MREIEMHDTNGITFLAVAECGGKTYFSAWGRNGLFELHRDGRADFIMLFDKYDGESPMHEFAFRIRDTIMFIPSGPENEIAVFTPETRKIEYLKYPASEKKYTCRPFWGYVSRNNITYLLPNSYDAVLAFDHDSGKFTRYVLPVKSDAFGEEKWVIINGTTVDETVYFCPWGCSDLISFDLQTLEFKIWGKVKEDTFRHMFYVDGKLFLIPRILNSAFIIYDIQKNTFLERTMPSGMKGICICAFADENGNIYLLPNNESKVWIWNPVLETLRSIELKICGGFKKNELCFNEARDLWGGKIMSTNLEMLSHLMFDGKEIRLFDISKSNGLFLDILMNMVENHKGITVYEY